MHGRKNAHRENVGDGEDMPVPYDKTSDARRSVLGIGSPDTDETGDPGSLCPDDGDQRNDVEEQQHLASGEHQVGRYPDVLQERPDQRRSKTQCDQERKVPVEPPRRAVIQGWQAQLRLMRCKDQTQRNRTRANENDEREDRPEGEPRCFVSLVEEQEQEDGDACKSCDGEKLNECAEQQHAELSKVRLRLDHRQMAQHRPEHSAKDGFTGQCAAENQDQIPGNLPNVIGPISLRDARDDEWSDRGQVGKGREQFSELLPQHIHVCLHAEQHAGRLGGRRLGRGRQLFQLRQEKFARLPV